MSTNQGLWNGTFGQIGATLKALEDAGVTLNHLALLRSDKALTKAVADLIIEKTINPTEADKQLLSILEPERFFGPTDWMRHFGLELPESIALPILIDELKSILDGPCPFVNGKTVKETHYLFYLPADIKGAPLTVKQWQEMFPDDEQPCFYSYMEDDAWYNDFAFAKTDTARFSWFLMFEGVIPGSESKNWEEQIAMKSDGYEVPKLVECTPMHFLAYKKNDGQRINENMWGRTCDVDSGGDHVDAGDFDSDGFGIDSHCDSVRLSSLGLFLFRKF